MDKDRVEGPLKEAGGKAKEAWGDLTNDRETEAEGEADQVEGKVQHEWGEGKDTVRDATDD
ncbi:MAG: CsbD family protein [Chloroflexi bacterium]|nr:CsbD family protein [Chloroflexota bacterium]